MWSPNDFVKENSQIRKFETFVSEKRDLSFEDYFQLHKWTIEKPDEFWSDFWDFSGFISSKKPEKYITSNEMPGCNFFPGARLNFAENMLRFRDDRIAYQYVSEHNSEPQTMTFNELYNEVAFFAKALRNAGVKQGDKVCGLLPNIPKAAIAMLAAASIGAVWSSCSPDFGLRGITDRFGQIEPKILVTTAQYKYKAKAVDMSPKLVDLLKNIPSIEKVVVCDFSQEGEKLELGALGEKAIAWTEFVGDKTEVPELVFEQLPFEHPVVIMYSSGTTGIPKAIVQGTGILLNHIKELILHSDVTREDNFFFFTTTGWMMWNWLTSVLCVGATVVLFEGCPLYPDAGALFKMAQDCKVTCFGCSARYLEAVKSTGLLPRREYDLSNIRALFSTGSPASPEVFEFACTEIGNADAVPACRPGFPKGVQFCSISGGTDLNGCFALGCPLLDVNPGELQCFGLGLNVDVFNDEGDSVKETKGELVCKAPFPSMPLCFFGDKDGKRYFNAYFDHFPGVWRHGDFAEVTVNNGLIIHGRSDATLNPGGVRIGTAELYRVIEEHFPEVIDCIAVGQSIEKDVRVLLFLQMRDGIELTEEMKIQMCKTIRQQASPRHVPAVLLPISDIPYTLSGKKVEMAVRCVIEGGWPKNVSALKNPDALNEYKTILGDL